MSALNVGKFSRPPVAGEFGLFLTVAVSLARAIARLQASPALRDSLGEQGRKALGTWFGIDTVAARVQALYARILGLAALHENGARV
ncbi:hypothetical protein CCR91_18100 [Thiorhodovibrio winogradskyi]|nr:hypothetical protein [Thiorhodovibrio winogradskyi]